MRAFPTILQNLFTPAAILRPRFLIPAFLAGAVAVLPISSAIAAPLCQGASIIAPPSESLEIVEAAFRGGARGVAVRRGGGTVWRGGGAVVRRGGAAVWRRPGSYWWPVGGAIAAGAAIGFVSAAAAAAWAGSPPASGYCWYYTDASRRQGFWDQCP
ncbi:MAG: hypothetical protein L0Y57_00475 [Beijerinckiaceae bacterium]|nr:hypothetical protein [Beijerinckiaceae bacterium]